MPNKYGKQRPRQKTYLYKMCYYPQHNTPDKKLYCYDNAHIAIYNKYSSNT